TARGSRNLRGGIIPSTILTVSKSSRFPHGFGGWRVDFPPGYTRGDADRRSSPHSSRRTDGFRFGPPPPSTIAHASTRRGADNAHAYGGPDVTSASRGPGTTSACRSPYPSSSILFREREPWWYHRFRVARCVGAGWLSTGTEDARIRTRTTARPFS